MTALLITKAWDVDRRLRELGLSTAGLHEVGRAAYRARAFCSPLHPPTYPGTAAWGAAVFTLRDKYLPLGWRHADPGNFSMTINDQRGIYIVVATGDEFAGRVIGRTPTTKTPKGMKTEAAVRRQGEFWPDAVPEEAIATIGVTKYTAYWMLLNFAARSLLIELSSPSDIENGKITAWYERIILPPIDFDIGSRLPDGDRDDDFGPDVDVPVERIG